MNILIISPSAGAPEYGMVFRNYDLARCWVEAGHAVTILTASYAHTRSKQPLTTGWITKENIDGIEYIFLKSPRYSQAGTIGRVLSMAAFSLQAYFIPGLAQKSYHLVIGSSPPPFVIYPAAKLAKKFQAKLVYDVRDLWPLTLKQLGNYTSYNPLIWLMQRAENYACRKVDLITAVPRNSEDYLRERGLPPGRFLHIPNGALSAKPDIESLPETHLSVIKKLKKEKKFLIGYTGSVGRANALHSAVAALQFAEPNIVFIILGQGGHVSVLQKFARDCQVSERVIILPAVNKKQAADFIKHMDVCYIGLQNQEIFKLGASPTKLNDYMLAAKPVLYAVGDPGNPVESSKCGLVAEPESHLSIAAAMNKFYKMKKSQLKQMGLRGQKFILKNNLSAEHAKKILDVLFP